MDTDNKNRDNQARYESVPEFKIYQYIGDFEIEGTTLLGYSGFDREVVIPDGVESIAAQAFAFNSPMCSLIIPQSVSDISYDAFAFCKNLKSITVDENNECYCSVSGVLFDKNKSKLIIYPSGKDDCDYVIPDGVVSINRGAFSHSGVVTINISESVRDISGNAFAHCSELKCVYVDNRNENYCSVDGILFSKDRSELIYLPGARTGSEYEIPDGVTTIKTPFSYPNLLETIKVPQSVEYIDECAFKDCNKLECIEVDENNENYCSIDGVLFSADKRDLIYYPNNKQDAVYEVPDTVCCIKTYAFGSSYKLKKIVVPDGVELKNQIFPKIVFEIKSK